MTETMPQRPTPIEYTPHGTGTALDGVLLRGGRPLAHPEHGEAVDFGRVKIGRKEQRVLVRCGGKPDLAALAAEYRSRAEVLEAWCAAAAAALEPCGFLYEAGCDAADTWLVLTPPGVPWEVRQRRPDLNDAADLVRRHLRDEDLRAVAEATGAEPLPATHSTYGGWRFGAAGYGRLLSLARERDAESRAKAAARREVSEKTVADARAVARASGQPVAVRSWTEPCDGSAEECSLDACTQLAYPDGSLRVRRVHTH